MKVNLPYRVAFDLQVIMDRYGLTTHEEAVAHAVAMTAMILQSGKERVVVKVPKKLGES